MNGSRACICGVEWGDNVTELCFLHEYYMITKFDHTFCKVLPDVQSLCFLEHTILCIFSFFSHKLKMLHMICTTYPCTHIKQDHTNFHKLISYCVCFVILACISNENIWTKRNT